MTEPDLTPSTFIDRVKTKGAVRRWAAPLIVCAILSIIPIALEHTRPADNQSQLVEQRILQAQDRIELGQSRITMQSLVLAQRQRERQAEQNLTMRPDWSGVLSLIARQFDDQLMMTACELGEAADSRIRGSLGQIRDDVPGGSVWMILTGVAAANSDVPGLIIRLESLGLFVRVVMTSSQRETVAGDSRTIFTLACRVQ